MDQEKFLAWTAGFIDADGTITIKRQRRGRSIAYVPHVSLGQSKTTHKSIAIKKIQEHFGGNIYEYKTKSGSYRLNVMQWSLTSRSAYQFVEKIKPYLIVRYGQAEILMEFVEKFINGKFHRISKEEQFEREEYFYKMRELNVRGKLRLKRLSEEAPKKEMQQSEQQQ